VDVGLLVDEAEAAVAIVSPALVELVVSVQPPARRFLTPADPGGG
jgi:hypothetical protein